MKIGKLLGILSLCCCGGMSSSSAQPPVTDTSLQESPSLIAELSQPRDLFFDLNDDPDAPQWMAPQPQTWLTFTMPGLAEHAPDHQLESTTVVLCETGPFAPPYFRLSIPTRNPTAEPLLVNILKPETGHIANNGKTEEERFRPVQVTLSTPRSRYFLGERITLIYQVHHNQPGQIVPIRLGATGGEYRRHDQYKVVAWDEQGNQLADPKEELFNRPWRIYSGHSMFTHANLKAGQVVYDLLCLNDFCVIEKPGRYTISVYNSLGRDQPEYATNHPNELPVNRDSLQAPIVTLTIEVLEPDAEAAENVIEWTHHYLGDCCYRRGEIQLEFRDWKLLRRPVYLLPLVRVLNEHPKMTPEVITGIASIPEREAVAELVNLLEKLDDPKLRLQIVKRLLNNWAYFPKSSPEQAPLWTESMRQRLAEIACDAANAQTPEGDRLADDIARLISRSSTN